MTIKAWTVLLGLLLLISSCGDDNGTYTQIKDIEELIYKEIKSFRESKGLSGSFVHQYMMVTEAQLYSYKMANGFEEVGTQGINEHWDALEEKWTFYNRSALVLKTMEDDAERILQELLAVQGIEAELLADVTQCGVGVEAGQDDFNYITILLAKAD